MNAAVQRTGAEKSDTAEWLRVSEKGTAVGIRFLVWVCTTLGRPAARGFLPLIARYYALFHRDVRAASAQYLRRIHGTEPSAGLIYRHVLRFTQVTLDSVFLLARRDGLFEVSRNGHHHLHRLRRRGEGAILLSAHVGSRSAMMLDGHDKLFRINLAGHFGNAARINRVLGRIDSDSNTRVVNIEPGDTGAVLAIRDLVRDGQMVAMTADRIGLNDRAVGVPFLGSEAQFAVGPFLIAYVLHCPVFLVFALYREPNRYELYCEPFEMPTQVAHGKRDDALRDAAERYAERVEHYCRMAPDNWFNFFPFWEQP